METKTQYLTSLAALSYIEEVGVPDEVTTESVPEIKYTVYDVYILERNNGEGVAYKHRFVVYDEGGGNEEVLTVFSPKFDVNLSGYNALIAEIESITDQMGYWIRNIDTEQQFAIVRCMILVSGSPNTINVKWYLIYNDSGLTYAEINNPEDF